MIISQHKNLLTRAGDYPTDKVASRTFQSFEKRSKCMFLMQTRDFFPISSQLRILNPTCLSPCKVITNDTQGSAWVVIKFSIRSAVNLCIQYFGHKLLLSYERNPNIFAFFLLLYKALD